MLPSKFLHGGVLFCLPRASDYGCGSRAECTEGIDLNEADSRKFSAPARIRDRLQAWQDIGKKNWVGSLVLVGADAAAMRVIAESVL
jgi:hypothetical protein